LETKEGEIGYLETEDNSITITNMELFEIKNDLVPKHYKITKTGIVVNTKTGNHFPKPQTKTNNAGYYIIVLKRKSFGVHRLMAETFLANPDNLPTVEHIDRNSTNNNLGNLKWATWEEQWKNRKNPESKFSLEQKQEMLEMYRNGVSQTKIAKLHNVTQPCISKILRQLRTQVYLDKR